MFDQRSGKTLEIYDGQETVVFHVYKEIGLDDGTYKIFVDAEIANEIIKSLVDSRHLSSDGFIEFKDRRIK